MSKVDEETSKKSAYIFLGAVCLLILLSLFVRSFELSAPEEKLFNIVYGLPSLLSPVAYATTQTGSLLVALVLSAVLFMIGRARLAISVASASILAFSLAYWLKLIVDRPRPTGLLENIAARHEFASGKGFPSGHTAVAAAVALVLSAYTPKKYQPLLVLWVAAVALSRIYLGVHAPLDVIGGLLVGFIAASFVIKVTARKSGSGYAKSRK